MIRLSGYALTLFISTAFGTFGTYGTDISAGLDIDGSFDVQGWDVLPKCWSNCISSQKASCDFWDISCLCQASNGDFLTNVVNCARKNCDSHFDASLLISPLETACAIMGQPISGTCISSASAAATATLEIGASIGASAGASIGASAGFSAGFSAGGSGGASITQTATAVTTYVTSMTRTTTDADGTTIFVIETATVCPGSTTIFGSALSTIAASTGAGAGGTAGWSTTVMTSAAETSVASVAETTTAQVASTTAVVESTAAAPPPEETTAPVASSDTGSSAGTSVTGTGTASQSQTSAAHSSPTATPFEGSAAVWGSRWYLALSGILLGFL
ncbi:uncharacterized protein K452DRAFT_356135 [Aplosporella prunicola CBS 121167]|uniref:CFEM domain-containing protein n=1 Tax=Aplosporella prunicola CBS 121167 TaxID=1176127 RepID=A0A6A6BNU1_9PEZI|nr:uncharacterized protein K452DRAFT_356135 [Aplosporella prunicola CBS 121167]KAF2145746.1 hypothetical protein K452DRAFT_356135 [Aplosporella prunicola CBS 121167]